jgi:hypothetical protein
MFGFRGPSRRTPLDELKERLSLPPLKDAEADVRNFYEGRNPFEHLKAEWPVPYGQFVRGFAYALDRARKDGIVDWARQEKLASMTAIGMARASFKPEKEAA